MVREYYYCCVRLDGTNHFFIWFLDEKDGVYLDSEGNFIVSDDLRKLEIYAERQTLSVKNEEPAFYDLDKLEDKLTNKKYKVDCVEFLNAWNLFDDVSGTIGGSFDSDRKITKKIYEKLFWGNNLPAVTPEGKSYEPIWSRKELEIIREVLLNGIIIFRNNLKNIN